MGKSIESRKRRAIVGISAAVVAIVAALGAQALLAKPHVPDVSFTLLSGKKISTSTDLKGKVFLVNFWDTDCSSCITEMPQLSHTYDQFHDRGLEFVAVAMSYTPPTYAMNYARTRHLPFEIALDDGSAAKKFGNVQLTPTTLLVDQDGVVLKRYVGPPDFKQLDTLIDNTLTKAKHNG